MVGKGSKGKELILQHHRLIATPSSQPPPWNPQGLGSHPPCTGPEDPWGRRSLSFKATNTLQDAPEQRPPILSGRAMAVSLLPGREQGSPSLCFPRHFPRCCKWALTDTSWDSRVQSTAFGSKHED